MSDLIVIGPLRTSDSQGSDFVREAKAQGHRVIVVTSASERAPEDVHALADHLVRVEADMESDEAADEAVAKIRALAVAPAAIFPGTEQGVLLAAVAGERLGLHSNGSVVGRVLRNKYQQRRILERHGFPTPFFHRFSTERELAALLPRLTFPVVLKPVNGLSKVGVMKAFDADGLMKAFRNGREPARTRYRYLEIGAEWLVEEFIEGDKLTLELIVAGEGQITPLVLAETTVVGDNFIEIGHALPSALSPETQAEVHAYGVAVLEAVGVRHGVVHLELLRRRDDGRLFVIELNGRIPGGRVAKLIEAASGNNYYRIVLATLLSRRVPALKPFRRAVAVHWFCRTTGEVAAVEGFDELDGSPGFLEKFISVGVGDRLVAFGDGTDRVGYSMNAAADLASAKARARAAASCVRIVYR
ncbi:ATP-grasp domain-containing protein [Polyangium sp. 15x6]|uniref:ATP-grasp domain-containing protein n=1 Tax=Polyangium sp. 15x6 TaxID=3042687 RepID=UPI00249C5FD9|nr:ATP-grasp domain-containing protein [Polyangium sp. 15x6]MDI3289011.1 ATP-grasp domain-containing protein [Polyangium sp. 15x6]